MESKNNPNSTQFGNTIRASVGSLEALLTEMWADNNELQERVDCLLEQRNELGEQVMQERRNRVKAVEGEILERDLRGLVDNQAKEINRLKKNCKDLRQMASNSTWR